MTRNLVWSYGGGIQSVAIGVLITHGKLPKPDIVIMADTSREGKATWHYLDTVMRNYLSKQDLTVEVAPHALAKNDLMLNDDLLLPLYTKNAKMPTFCSGKWKRDVVGRWLRLRGVKECDEWIGFSYDEIRRVPEQDRVQWRHRVYPLIDLMLTRADCYSIIHDEGLPLPPKSACWCCPHRNNSEWRFLRDEWPGDWDKAIQLERGIHTLDSEVWFHQDRIPLDRANIDKQSRLDVGQCGLGYCFL